MAKSTPPRKKPGYTPPPAAKAQPPSPQWYKVLMVSLMVGGLVWVVATYLGTGSQRGIPIPGLDSQWNLLVGFALMLAGFIMTTRWR